MFLSKFSLTFSTILQSGYPILPARITGRLAFFITSYIIVVVVVFPLEPVIPIILALSFIKWYPTSTSFITSIPKASRVEHLKMNIEASKIQISDESWKLLDSIYPSPKKKLPLDME